MLVFSLILVLFVLCVDGVSRNVSCPDVTPRELDWKEMDGTWYLSAVATDLRVQGDCAMVLFDHQNTLGVSIKWITNHTASYYNGSVALIPDPKSNTTGDLLQVTYDDQKTETYSFLDINYEHYAVVFACYDNEDGNSSTYSKLTVRLVMNECRSQDADRWYEPMIPSNIFEDEIWKMTRTPHLKDTDAAKLDAAIASYNLQDTQFISFNNTEDTCRVNGGQQVDTSTLILTSAAAITLFRRMY